MAGTQQGQRLSLQAHPQVKAVDAVMAGQMAKSLCTFPPRRVSQVSKQQTEQCLHHRAFCFPLMILSSTMPSNSCGSSARSRAVDRTSSSSCGTAAASCPCAYLKASTAVSYLNLSLPQCITEGRLCVDCKRCPTKTILLPDSAQSNIKFADCVGVRVMLRRGI